MEVNEKDWKLFRKKLSDWQERYMEKLVEEYTEMLREDRPASEKYWALEKRVQADKRSPGVLLTDIKRSNFIVHLTALLRSNVITLEDLDGFSDETKEVSHLI